VPEIRNPKPETRNKSELIEMGERETGNRSISSHLANNFDYCSADIIGTTTSRQGRKGREELGTAEYAEYAEGDTCAPL
jgi:hypothetical protein